MSSWDVLEAVNSVLTDMGRSPVNQISTSQNPEASEIEQLLYQMTRKILERGWATNRREKVSLTPATNGEITIPANALSVEISQHYTQTQGLPKLTTRQGKLYDLDNGSYDLSAFASVLVNILERIDFVDLSHPMQSYVVDHTAYEYALKKVPDPSLHETLRANLIMSQARAIQEDVRNNNENMLTGNRSTYDIVSRRWNPTRRY